MPKRTRQFMEVPDSDSGRPHVTGEEQSHDQQSEPGVNIGAYSMASRIAAPTNAGKYRTISATNSGADYEPTRAQILASQMAEKFYSTQVTFVDADVTTFKAIVQKLTGNHVSSSSGSGDRHRTQMEEMAPGTVAAQPTTLVLDGSSNKKSVICTAPADRAIAKPGLSSRVSSSAVWQKSSLFKHPRKRGPNFNNRSVEIQRQQLQDASTIATGQIHAQCYSVLSAIPSPVSPLTCTVCNEFENGSTSGDGSGGEGSAVDTRTQLQVHGYVNFSDHLAPGSNEYDSLIDRSFTFPQLSIGKEEAMLSRPKLLHLFPETPDDR